MTETETTHCVAPIHVARHPEYSHAPRLHILLVTGSYAPDPTGVAPLNTEMCEYLAARGHQVSVLTCFPHYPDWTIPRKYRGKLWHREKLGGVQIYRAYVLIPTKRTAFRRILYDTSIALGALFRGLPIRNVDAVLAVSPPLQAGLAGCVLARLKRAPFLFQLQDVLPDLAIALGMLRNPLPIRLAQAMEQYVYRRADAVLVICEGFRQNLLAKGVPGSKILLAPNWVDLNFIGPRAPHAGFRDLHRLRAADFLALHIGNIGVKQGLENVLEAAARVRESANIQFCFVGDGTEKKRLQELAQSRKLSNVIFLPLQPREILPAMLSSADALLLNQSTNVVDMVIPSKLLTYMAAGRPVVAAVSKNSETAKCIDRAGCGLVVESENPAALAQAIRRLSLDRELANHLGQRGRSFAEEHFARDRILDCLESHLLSLLVTKGKRVEV